MTQNQAMENTYREYLSLLFRSDLVRSSHILGFEYRDGIIGIDFFGKKYRISPDGITGEDGKRPAHSVNVVLCKYIILSPPEPPGGSDWITYREFRDAAPFAGSFRTNTEAAIARFFSGKMALLEDACTKAGGARSPEDLPYQLVMKFTPLAQVPLMLLFNDADEEFPSQCVILFQKRAGAFLDMECLAITGWLLADYLYEAAGSSRKTIM